MTAPYKILIHQSSFNALSVYQKEIAAGKIPGQYLNRELIENKTDIPSNKSFLECLLNTKRPRIYAESEVLGDGSDWTQDELRLLGDISIVVPVTVYDNGAHSNPLINDEPFQASLIYTPGALLRNDRGNEPADLAEVARAGHIDPEGYYKLYERRLLPAFSHASQRAGEQGRKALVTLPGIGCGQFAGPFRGQMEEHLKAALLRLLETHSKNMPDLQVVYYDPYSACQNENYEIEPISCLVRPLTQGNRGKSQLCPPIQYQKGGEDYSACELFSIVAWDHVSWPGNDFYGGMRATDDGVKAAATDSMSKMTGIEGRYDPIQNKYQPPNPYNTWEEVVEDKSLRLIVEDNLAIYP